MRYKKLKLKDGEASDTVGGSGEGVPKEGKVETRPEVCEWEG